MVRVLATFYFLVFAYIGVLIPWFPPLLAERGLGAAMIGVSLFAIQIPRALLPPAWGLLADRLAQPRGLLAAATVAAGAAFALVGATHRTPLVLALLFAHGLLVVPVFPLAEVFAFRVLGADRERYGRVRAWGSLGFIVTSLGTAPLVDRLGLSVVPWLAGGLLVAAGLLALAFPGGRFAARARRLGAAEALRLVRRLAPLLAVAALGQASHGAYYAFFTIQLVARGWSNTAVGLLWAWAVVCEIGLMSASPLILRRVALSRALALALAAGGVRWLVTALDPAPVALVAAQALHAGSFALLHVATVQLVDRLSPPPAKAFGQSLASAA
ncbi:MAG: MFS transporter, partial [Acidobacteria bacterium]